MPTLLPSFLVPPIHCYIHNPSHPPHFLCCPCVATYMPLFLNLVFCPTHMCFATYAPPPLPLISCPHFLSHTFVATYIYTITSPASFLCPTHMLLCCFICCAPHMLLNTCPHTSSPHFLYHTRCYIHVPTFPPISCPTHTLLHNTPYFSPSFLFSHMCSYIHDPTYPRHFLRLLHTPPSSSLVSCPIHVLLHNAPYFSPHFLSHTFVATYKP